MDYLAVVRRRWRVIAVATLAGVGAAVAALILATNSYDATATVRVATGLGTADSIRLDSVEYTDRLMNTYRELAQSNPLRREVARRSGATELPVVEVDIPSNTELMGITVRAEDPKLAQRQANLVAEEVVSRAREFASSGADSAQEAFGARLEALEKEVTDARVELEAATRAGASSSRLSVLGDQLALREDAYRALLEESTTAQSAATSRVTTVSVEERATVPSSPSRPRKALTLGLGLVLGLIGGIGLAFLWEGLDRRVYGRDEVAEQSGSPVLATIPSARKDMPASVFNSHSMQQEAFARLRTNLVALNGGPRLSTMLVTSAEPSAGKSTVTSNLAASLARDGNRVLVIDADLRLPTIHRVFDLPNEVGLSTLLVGRMMGQSRTLEEVTQETGVPSVSVLTSGPEVIDPAERLSSDDMAAVMAAASSAYDVVVVDTPALLSVSDAAPLVSLADAVLLVVREGHTSRNGLRDALEQLRAVKAKDIGVVVNCGRDVPTSYYTQYARRERVEVRRETDSA